MKSDTKKIPDGPALWSKPDNSMAKPLAALAALPRCGARARSTGAPCRQPGIGAGGRCRWHGGASTGRPTTSNKYTKVAEANVERVRILLHLLQELNPHIEPSGWFRPPRGDRDPVKLIEKYKRLTRQVERATTLREMRDR
jgi:hypothetical protein